ncbi:MAG: UDP-N-acetylmuramoyl-L-alanyl-D-glutamate--2,6-diaminopimelate ligase [Patescibacteria group bacterium]|nr:UDP-N-acetylmuramoyl-L-alanyl-D-glutamate--2,6-diaminopimelate ligase [Patescibacteria group bacterium]
MIKKILKKIIPLKFLRLYYQAFPALGALLYRFPSRKLTVIGVTGTNGKSTVVELITNILQEAEFKVASISSVRFQIKDQVWQNDLKMTMPGRLKIQRFFKKAVNADCKYVVLEVTSEGIKQFRHKFINFNTVVFTNLTKEHIEAHGSFENYRKTKGKLFKNRGVKTVIVNTDDENAEYFLNFNIDKKWGYCIDRKEIKTKIVAKELETIKGKKLESLEDGIRMQIKGVKFNLKLLGEFNAYNTLAAVCTGLSEGISLEKIKQALEKIDGVSGRMELVVKEPFKVYVDYAHTPNALENVYKTLAGNRLICVLGSCGGGRDKWKRPEFGRIAANYCSQIILTNEDPYGERPQKILKDIEKGILEYDTPSINHKLIFNRKGAIKEALALARVGDTVIITGKGSEPWMCVANGKKIPWDDRKIVREEIEKLNSKN